MSTASIKTWPAKPTTIAEVLERTLALLEDPRRWTQGELARTSRTGKPVPWDGKRARCWCLIGALSRATWDGDGPWRYELFASATTWLTSWLRQAGLIGDVVEFNDHRPHGQVIESLRAAHADALAAGI